MEFKDGAVTDYGAEKAKEALDQLIETDEGSRHLGEVALISYDSPISNMNILFFNTLFDENASCHLALGRCYPENIKGGSEMTEEELLAAGGNHSLNHVDFIDDADDTDTDGGYHHHLRFLKCSFPWLYEYLFSYAVQSHRSLIGLKESLDPVS